MKSPIVPVARKTDLITRQIPGELLVYDLKRHKAICLNETAAIVWRRCDGRRMVSDLAAELEEHYQTPVDELVVWLALEQLDRACLLRSNTRRRAQREISRRGLVRAGVIAAVVPIVTMIVAPTPQSAATTTTRALCRVRKQSDPGGCGGAVCSDRPGSCKPSGASNCDCS